MAKPRIAVLFDAENINCDTAHRALSILSTLGTVQIKRAVGDFSAASLATWIGCGRDNGIELILQPSLGKGKNGADIKLTIEAMDIVHQRGVDTVALVTRDRDFTPLALRLREAGLTVLGFAQTAPSAAFSAACSDFKVMGKGEPMETTKPTGAETGIMLDASEQARLRVIVAETSQGGPIKPHSLSTAIIAADPQLAKRLGGQGKFLKTLAAHGLVERVGSGPDLTVRSPRLQKAG